MSSSEVHMHFYPHNIGQFAADTSGMSLSHVGALIRLIDRYAQTEKPIKTEWVNLAFRGEELGFAKDVLSAMFSQTEDGFIYDPLTETIADYQKSAEARRENGKKGGRPRKKNLNVTEQVSLGFQNGGCEKPNCNRVGLQPITNNQEPITKNQDREEVEEESAPAADCSYFDHLENEEPAISSTTESRSRKDADANEDKEKRQATELYHDDDGKAAKVRRAITTTLDESGIGETVPDDWREYCEQVRPDIDARTMFADFRFYYTKGSGMGKRQKNWTSTWQGWVRRQKVDNRTAPASRETKRSAMDISGIDYSKAYLPNGEVDWGI